MVEKLQGQLYDKAIDAKMLVSMVLWSNMSMKGIYHNLSGLR